MEKTDAAREASVPSRTSIAALLIYAVPHVACWQNVFVFATVEIGDLHAYIIVWPLAVTNSPVLAQSRGRRS